MTRTVGNRTHSVARNRYYLVASRVEDRFGNTVNYTYNADGNPTSIDSSDGRAITLTYVSGRLSSAMANGRVWRYEYWTGAYAGMLKTVVLPGTGAESWQYAYTGTLKPLEEAPWDGGSNASCSIRPARYVADFGVTVTHPSGASGAFQFHNKRHFRAGIHASECLQGVSEDPNWDTYYYVLNTPNYFDVMSLATKTLAGPALVARTWSYEYGGSNQALWGNRGSPAVYPCASCPTEKLVTVTNPDATTREYRYGFLYALNEGRLLGTTVRDQLGAVKRVETTTYMTEADAVAQTFFLRYGLIINGDDRSTAAVRPVTSQTIVQDGVTFTMAVNTGCQGASVYCFDVYGNPTRTTKSSSSSPTHARTAVTSYFHQTEKWILGQVASITCVAPASCINSTWPGGMELSRTTYNATFALPEHEYAFGKLKRSYVWNGATGTDQAGTLVSVADGGGNATQLSYWMRGVPTLVRHPGTLEVPAGATQSAVVDGNGWITSVTDESGATTGYQYDGTMGRLTRVNYPTEDPAFGVTWTATTSAFGPTGAAAYGLPANHWVHTVSTGNARKVIRYDALWRAVIEETYDNADPANTRTLLVRRYDAAGRLAFQSYPLRTTTNWSTVANGTTTRYDALGRATETSVPSTDPGATNGVFLTKVDYLAGFRQQVTSPNNTVTTTSFLAWDQPTTEYPMAIAHPEGAYTDIARDAFGKPTAIVRRDLLGALATTRNLVYRGDTQELCRTVEPETGSTVMEHDAAGNVAWSASGMSIGGTSLCSYGSVPVASRTLRSYDARNRLKSLSFPDGNGDQDWAYWPSGQPSKVTTWNIGFPGAEAKETINVYIYNKRGLLEAETVAVPAWYTFTVDHAYDGNGHVKKTTYPSGNAVDYTLNALGQPSALVPSGGTPYASQVTYHPNGAAERFVYGNGIEHTMDQNDRQLPRRSWMRKGGADHLDDAYAYDGNGNVTSIVDNRLGGSGRRTRTMTYDGLDRLQAVASNMYGAAGATYTYNVLDDLTRVKIGGTAARDHYYCYDNGQLTSIRTAACSGGGSTVHGLGYDVQGNLENKNGQHYRFDYGNRLREVDGVERYRYDAHGRRVLAMQFATGTVLSMYGQDGRLMYQKSDRTGQQSDYLYLGGSLVAIRDEPIGGGAASLKYQHTDALGSPVVVTNEAGTALETTEYEPYGKVLNRPVHDGPGYTGHVEDAATGLVQMQQRYYDPGIGRFLSVDPVTAYSSPVVQFNRYRYANSNPYRFIDPDGRCARATGSMICGGAAGMAAMATTAKAIPTGARAESKSLSGVPAAADRNDQKIVGNVNKGIEGARGRIDRAKDPVLNGAWNSTEWKWNPTDPELSGEKTAAYVNPALPQVVNVGRYFGRFADSTQMFDYHNASFVGGSSALTFAALHEFAHVVQAGVGTPGAVRERMANGFAYRRIHFTERGNFECDGCME
nr:RHS repeat-associated core domain-containing protein [Luteimonas sp. MC1782]